MSELGERIEALAERARADRESFDPPADPPDEERAVAYLRDGVGDAVSLYVEARSGEMVALTEPELSSLHRAVNDWLDLYARCYGVEIEAAFTVREVAELVVSTHNLRDTARLLTGVPERDRGVAWSRRKIK